MNVVLPPGCVTGVGSLPFIDPLQAIQFVAKHSPVIPFWPQLPLRHPAEAMVVQGLGVLGTRLETPAKQSCWQLPSGMEEEFATALDAAEGGLIPATAAGFFAFENALQTGGFPQALAAKAQSVGPVTLAFSVFDKGQPLASQPGWLDRFSKFMAKQAVWQVHRLQACGKPVIMVLDEPTLGIEYTSEQSAQAQEIIAAVNSVLRAVRSAGALAGIHCCAPLPLTLMQNLDVDLVSFDAHLPMDRECWTSFAHSMIARCGHFAFGLVPTDSKLKPNVSELVDRWQLLAGSNGDIRQMATRTLVTATCGLGLSTPEHAAYVFENCRQVSERISQLVQFTRP